MKDSEFSQKEGKKKEREKNLDSSENSDDDSLEANKLYSFS